MTRSRSCIHADEPDLGIPIVSQLLVRPCLARNGRAYPGLGLRLFGQERHQAGRYPARFEDVVKILHERLGTSARVIAYRTMVELYKEFSLNANFDYEDSIEDRFVFLKERVLADRLHPTRTPSLKLAF